VRLLILGGTRFVGRHIAQAGLERGWDVTLFNRGLHDAGAFPDAEHRIGDRDGGLQALDEGTWDVVIDTCGYVPRIVRASAELLGPRIGLYVYISSASVYADKSQPGLTEDAPLVELENPASEDVEAHYDGLKAACEQAVLESLNGRAAIVRPGLIVGPHDPTNRFTYWVTRMAGGGEVLAPEPAAQPVQVIDARDLADWALRLAAAGAAGTYNAVGDVRAMGEVLSTIAAATGGGARLRWIEERRLLAAGLEPWRDVPLWLAPGTDPSYRGFLAMSNGRAKAAGLQLRPLAETVRDTLDWARREPAPADPPAGLDPDVERRLLAGG
jgi:nucleoside-diphosphate-sugar epimerase